MVPDSQVLVEKIVKLQRLMAKKQEKLEFMEEHVSTLLGTESLFVFFSFAG